MLDIDFLQRPPAHDGAIVYLCQSEILVPRFKQAVFALAKTLGSSPDHYRPAAIVTAERPGSLFDQIYRYCDWRWDVGGVRATRRSIPNYVEEQVLAVLTSGRAKEIAIVLPAGHALTRNPHWPAAAAHCVVLEESIVTSANLRPHLEYLAATSDLSGAESFIAQESFFSHFEDLAGGEECSLAELSRRFDEVVLTQCDPHTNRVAEAERVVEGLGRKLALLRILRPLIFEQRRRELLRLTADSCDRRARGWTLVARHRELYRSAEVLLSSGQDGGTTDAGRPELKSALIWAAVLLAWQERLASSGAGGRRVPELFGVRLDQMARCFLKAATARPSNDPLARHWNDIRKTLRAVAPGEVGGLATARRDLLKTVAERGAESEAEWARRLGALAAAAIMQPEPAIKGD